MARGATDLSPVARNRSPRPMTGNPTSMRPLSAGGSRPQTRPQSAADRTPLDHVPLNETVVPSASYDDVIEPPARSEAIDVVVSQEITVAD